MFVVTGMAQAQSDNKELVAKGQYIFSVAAGCACHMYDAIQGTSHGYRNMSRPDALAIADYLKSIPAITNKVK
jgi:hypothetical protein